MYSTNFEWVVEITGLLYRGQYTNGASPELRSTTLKLPLPVGRLMETDRLLRFKICICLNLLISSTYQQIYGFNSI